MLWYQSIKIEFQQNPYFCNMRFGKTSIVYVVIQLGLSSFGHLLYKCNHRTRQKEGRVWFIKKLSCMEKVNVS